MIFGSLFLHRPAFGRGGSRPGQAAAGFSLIELMTVVVVISILVVMVLSVSSSWRSRADEVKCMTNLKSLYVGATNYIQEQGHWPQIDTKLIQNGGHGYATAWFQALLPYGISRQVWVCPTVQIALGNPDLDNPDKFRVDYLATPFDDKPRTPYRWSTQPWFIEKASSHPHGNLMIFEDGLMLPLSEAVKRVPPPAE